MDVITATPNRSGFIHSYDLNPIYDYTNSNIINEFYFVIVFGIKIQCIVEEVRRRVKFINKR